MMFYHEIWCFITLPPILSHKHFHRFGNLRNVRAKHSHRKIHLLRCTDLWAVFWVFLYRPGATVKIGFLGVVFRYQNLIFPEHKFMSKSKSQFGIYIPDKTSGFHILFIKSYSITIYSYIMIYNIVI